MGFFNNTNKQNVLFIPDLHLPFAEAKALTFTKELYKEHNITDVVFGGDIIDNHFSSFHDTDPDGMGGNEELTLVRQELVLWHDAFPKAIVLLGNHDKIPARKAFKAGLSKSWVKTLPDMFDLEGWNFKEYHTIADWFMCHGDGMGAVARARSLGMSVIQFHYHSKMFAQLIDSNNNRWAVQGGCLVDHNSYAMAYAKVGPPMAKGCVIIKDIKNNPEIILKTFK